MNENSLLSSESTIVQLAIHQLKAASAIRLQRIMTANGVARNQKICRINYGLMVSYLGYRTLLSLYI